MQLPDWLFHALWLIPATPLFVAGVSALLSQKRRGLSAGLAIGGQAVSLLLSLIAFSHVLGSASPEGPWRGYANFTWLKYGDFILPLGFLLDPLTALMLVMVTFVSLLIFIFSIGYMSHDKNAGRFFCFLSLFSSGMLGIITANSLLLLFISWELVGLASYLLIGFWYHKPSAAAASCKAFITTRIGDIGFFIGILWLFSESGTLLFYDGGKGCLEAGPIGAMAAKTAIGGLSVSAAISLLLFCGAAGKSGQFPLHVWLPDAMEGPTPVSALIHAATMVAAGVFLVARMFPLFAATAAPDLHPAALTAVAWIGAFTALFAAVIAVAQFDIKRILAYSTVSQLGVMMLALGVGGVAAAMTHLIAHAFFKALLFLGAGSVIHGAHHEQDIRCLGGVRRHMPVTFATYAIGMMALSGVPFLFSGFWTKEAILHAAHEWELSQVPFYMAVAGAFLTAFYMTRQTVLVFFGKWRGWQNSVPHESPRVMTVPLILLAACAILMALVATPAWPWMNSFLTGTPLAFHAGHLFEGVGLMVLSILLVSAGIIGGWALYSRRPVTHSEQTDIIEQRVPALFKLLNRRLLVDEFYRATVGRAARIAALAADAADRRIWDGVVRLSALGGNLCAKLFNRTDRTVINRGFDRGCESVQGAGNSLSHLHRGRIQIYLRAVGLGAVALLIIYAWLP